MSKELSDLIPLVFNCGGPGSGRPGPCPMGGGVMAGIQSFKSLSDWKNAAIAKGYKILKGTKTKSVQKWAARKNVNGKWNSIGAFRESINGGQSSGGLS